MPAPSPSVFVPNGSGAQTTLCTLLWVDDEESRRDWIRLNVGGILFDTTRQVLLRQKDTFFEALLASGQWEPNEQGDTIMLVSEHILEMIRLRFSISPLGSFLRILRTTHTSAQESTKCWSVLILEHPTQHLFFAKVRSKSTIGPGMNKTARAATIKIYSGTIFCGVDTISRGMGVVIHLHV